MIFHFNKKEQKKSIMDDVILTFIFGWSQLVHPNNICMEIQYIDEYNTADRSASPL